MSSPVPGMYYVPNEIPDLGVSPGDFIHVDPAEGNYIHMRLVNKQVVDMILSSPGVRLVQQNTPQPSVPGCELFAVESHGTKADEIDVDALLAAGGTVREPQAQRLLWLLARGDEDRDCTEQRAEGAFDAWYRYLDWRTAPGHRVICSGCNTAFIRERKNGQLCVNCRRTWQRTCIDCGGDFPAPHPSFRRCPPCREAKR